MATTTPTAALPPPKQWQERTDQLLHDLETVGTSLIHLLSSLSEGIPSEAALLSLLSERGELIGVLTKHMEGVTATYVEWNRMVVIQHQGLQIEVNLRAARQRLVTQASAQDRNRAYLDCVTGVCNSEEPVSSSQSLLA